LEQLYFMTKAVRSIFRDEAIKSYIESREKDVLPLLVAPPVFLFLWILLGLLLTAGLLAWSAQVPIYQEGTGIVLEQQPASGQREVVALIFLPATSAPILRAGLPVQVQVGSSGPALTSEIEQVEPGILSPSAARTRYALASSVSETLTEPVVVVSVRLGPSIPAQLYAGSVVSAQVQVGSRRVLSLLPGLDQWMGD
jgi:hypothetical protein